MISATIVARFGYSFLMCEKRIRISNIEKLVAKNEENLKEFIHRLNKVISFIVSAHPEKNCTLSATVSKLGSIQAEEIAFIASLVTEANSVEAWVESSMSTTR